jgi:hypothetical protein
MTKLFRNRTHTIIIIVLMVALLSSLGGGIYSLRLSSVGYSTGFQGVHAKFDGIMYNSKKYESFSPNGASLAMFDTTLQFDADGATSGKPNVVGEMTSVFVPEESLSWTPVWSDAFAIPQEWLRRVAVIKNPQQTYEWAIEDKTYKMEQWVLRFYVSLSSEWDDLRGEGGGLIGGLTMPQEFGQVRRESYSNAELWFNFDMTKTWYIEGQGTAYFAVAKIQVAEFKKTAHDITGKEVELSTELSVSPQSVGALMYIYQGRWGVASAETTAQTYQGKKLNPEYFRDNVYARFTLNNFGVTSWNEYGTVKGKGDVATVAFDMTVFVIGEWDVKDVQQIPSDFGRFAMTGGAPSLLDYLNDPRLQGIAGIITIIAIVIVILIFAPWIFVVIFGAFGGRRRRK